MSSMLKALCLDGDSLTFSEVSVAVDSGLLKGESFTLPIDKEGISNPYVEVFGAEVNLNAMDFFCPSADSGKPSFVQLYDFGEGEEKEAICCRGTIYFFGFDLESNSIVDIKEDQAEFIKASVKPDMLVDVEVLHYHVDAS